jgi:hypothetical protein
MKQKKNASIISHQSQTIFPEAKSAGIIFAAQARTPSK